MTYQWIVDALEDTWGRVERVLAPQPPSAFERRTSCPGWTVRDVLSHLVGFEQMLGGEPVPIHRGAWPNYVKNPIGEMNEAFVAALRHESGPEVLERFRHVTRDSVHRARNWSEAQWEEVGWSPEGERPRHRFMETRILDGWIHLHDIRDALLEPADEHGAGEDVVVNRFEAALPYVVGKKMSAPDGTVLRLNLSGHCARSLAIGVVDGRARAIATTSATPTVEITTPVALFWRRAAGRISDGAFLAASATDVRGDLALAEGFARALVVMI